MRNIFPLVFIGLIFLTCWTSWNCEETITGGSADIVFPDSNVSYGRHVEPLFIRTCAFSPCHSHDAMADGLSLENYQDAISSKSGVILPGDTTNSRLIWRIEGKHNTVQMPLNRPALTDNQKRGLKIWILENARNN